PRGLRLLIGAILGLMLIGQTVPKSWSMLHGWGDPIIGEFLLGVLLARGFVRGWSLSRATGWALVAAGVALAIFCYSAGVYQVMWRLVTGGVPAVMIVAGAVLALEPRRANGWLRFLVLGGDASYALYLSHPFAVKLLALIETRIGWWHPGFFALTAVAAAILMAFAVHLLVERPLLALMMRRWSRFGSTGHGDGEPVAPITAPRMTPER
ncbi:MAG: acyltransferase family protein, partial [Sphingomonas sp.]|uniref:acyltransferase family protein n=1 Tax=Sphingomonas sp. TaxID=28214 RepID=UPI003F2CEA97